MKRKPIRRFPTGNAPPQKSIPTDKGYSSLEDELYYVEKEHINSRYRPIGLEPIGRFLSFHADSAASQKYFSEKWRLAGILILCVVLDMADGEIGRVMGMSRSAVQRHRTSTLKQLRTQLLALMPKGG